MRNFSKILTEAIDDLLAKEGVSSVVSNFKTAKEAYEKATSGIEDLKNEMNSKLAVEMRKILSEMGMVKNWSFIIRDGITFKYKSRSITLNPNFEKSIWELSPGSQSVGDLKFYKRVKSLDGCDLAEWKKLLIGIAEKFRENYKSLQSDDYIAAQQKTENEQETGEQHAE